MRRWVVVDSPKKIILSIYAMPMSAPDNKTALSEEGAVSESLVIELVKGVKAQRERTIAPMTVIEPRSVKTDGIFRFCFIK